MFVRTLGEISCEIQSYFCKVFVPIKPQVFISTAGKVGLSGVLPFREQNVLVSVAVVDVVISDSISTRIFFFWYNLVTGRLLVLPESAV